MDRGQTDLTQINNDHTYIAINYVFNIISIFFSSFLLIIIIALRAKQINLSNRMSLRLIMYISITELSFSIFQILKITPNLPEWMSYVSSWGFIFSTLLICFFIITILINIQLRFIHNYKDNASINKYYLIIPASLAIVLSGLPITLQNLIYNKERHYFWYDTLNMEWFMYQGWIAFVILYCSILLIFIKYRISKDPQRKSQILTDPTLSPTSTMVSASIPKQPIRSKLLLKYVSRISLYSLIPILAYLPSTIMYLIYSQTYNNNAGLNLFSSISISSQGIFTFVIFMLDPIIDEAILEHERNWHLKQEFTNKVKKGVYVNNIYNIDLELPSNKDQNQKNNRRSKYRSSIYVYARNRISGITSVISKKKSMEVDINKELFNFDSEQDDILYLL